MPPVLVRPNVRVIAPQQIPSGSGPRRPSASGRPMPADYRPRHARAATTAAHRGPMRPRPSTDTAPRAWSTGPDGPPPAAQLRLPPPGSRLRPLPGTATEVQQWQLAHGTAGPRSWPVGGTGAAAQRWSLV